MKEGMSAHLRRARGFLEWLDKAQGDAQVFWGGQPVGTWQSIRPRWRIMKAGIRFRFLALDREREFVVSTVRPVPRGAEILLSVSCRRMPMPLLLDWGPLVEADPREKVSREISQPALKWARQKFPGCHILSHARRTDRALTLSGSFLRIFLRYRHRDVFLLAAPAGDQGGEMPSALTQALLWVSHCRKRLQQVPLVHILVPSGTSNILCHRSQYLNPELATLFIWEYIEDSMGRWQARQAGIPDPPLENRDFRWPVLGSFRWSSTLAKVLELSPTCIRRYPRFQDYDSLRLWGLEFARALGGERDNLQFGVGNPQTELTEENFPALRSVVDEILYYRRPDSPDTRHPYYRMQAERWLESLILDEIPRLFPELRPESVYPQIPVYLGKEPGRVDILGADWQGRLVVMELKVTADPELPMQALDYWGRVVQHNQNGDFERRGYFSGMALDRRPPGIYLVSPVFSFHDTTERLLSYMKPGIEVWKVLLNEDWRSGVRVLRRTQLRCGGR